MGQQMHLLPNWSDFLAPPRCSVCGRALAPSGIELISQWNDMVYRSVMENLSRTWGSILEPWMEIMRSSWGKTIRSHGTHDCDCKRDDCHCRCCVGDADLLVYARLGEQRIAPLLIENSRRRERQVRLELSSWTSRSGKLAANLVSASLHPGGEFTLKPCEERTVNLLVNITGAQIGGTTAEPDKPGTQRLPDVDDCEVFYADLRVEGCVIRPIHIALALLPTDCAAYEIDCRCGGC